MMHSVMPSLHHLPVAHRARFRREAHSDAEQLALICFVRTGITLVFYLLQGFVGRAVQLELEDVDVAGHFNDAVHPAFALLLLRIDGVAAHHTHQQIERVMEVTLPLTLGFLAAHGVRDVGQSAGGRLSAHKRSGRPMSC